MPKMIQDFEYGMWNVDILGVRTLQRTNTAAGHMWTDPGNILNSSQTHEMGKLGLRPRNSQNWNT
jgi:hypothetical protein